MDHYFLMEGWAITKKKFPHSKSAEKKSCKLSYEKKLSIKNFLLTNFLMLK